MYGGMWVWVFICMSVWEYGVWVYWYLYVWVFICMSVWGMVYGCIGIYMYGCSYV